MADSPNNQPTILVKKADGSSVKVPMSEFIKMKEKKVASSSVDNKISTAPLSAPVAPIPDSSSEDQEEVKNQFDNLKNKLDVANQKIAGVKKTSDVDVKIKEFSAPVVKDPGFIDNLKGAFKENQVGVPVSKPVQVKKDKNFGRSLLEEKVDSVSVDAPKISSSRTDQISDILKKLSFSISSDNQNRLRTIIQLNLKDIRNESQTREVLERPIIEGGLELKPSQADELMELLAIEHGKFVPVNDIDDIPTVYKEPSLLAKGTPFNSFVHSDKVGKGSNKKRVADEKEDELNRLIQERKNKKAIVQSNQTMKTGNTAINEAIAPQDNKEAVVDKIIKSDSDPVFKLNTQASVKTVIHDVVPPAVSKSAPMSSKGVVESASVEYGPVEEIGHFSLVDFRRLSANPTEAAARLKQKLFNLRDESFLLYLSGLEALKQSPLYMEYMKAIDASLANRQGISSVVSSNSDSINLEEIISLVKMEEQL